MPPFSEAAAINQTILLEWCAAVAPSPAMPEPFFPTSLAPLFPQGTKGTHVGGAIRSLYNWSREPLSASTRSRELINRVYPGFLTEGAIYRVSTGYYVYDRDAAWTLQYDAKSKKPVPTLSGNRLHHIPAAAPPANPQPTPSPAPTPPAPAPGPVERKASNGSTPPAPTWTRPGSTIPLPDALTNCAWAVETVVDDIAVLRDPSGATVVARIQR